MVGGLASNPPFADTLFFRGANFYFSCCWPTGAFSSKCYKNQQKTAFFTPVRGGHFRGDVPRKAPPQKSYPALPSCPGTGPGTDCTYFRRKMKKRTSLNLLARHFGAPQKKKTCWGKMSPQKNGQKMASAPPCILIPI